MRARRHAGTGGGRVASSGSCGTSRESCWGLTCEDVMGGVEGGHCSLSWMGRGAAAVEVGSEANRGGWVSAVGGLVGVDVSENWSSCCVVVGSGCGEFEGGQSLGEWWIGCWSPVANLAAAWNNNVASCELFPIVFEEDDGSVMVGAVTIDIVTLGGVVCVARGRHARGHDSFLVAGYTGVKRIIQTLYHGSFVTWCY